MKLKSITIKKLFGLFDYNIDLNNEENLTILTGPNGYGKTTILNIIYNLFNQDILYFQQLNFELISLCFEDGKNLDIRKKITNIDEILMPDIQIKLFDNSGTSLESFVYDKSIEHRLIEELTPLFTDSALERIQNITGSILLKDFIAYNSSQITVNLLNLTERTKVEQIIDLLNSTKVYIIREERLIAQNKTDSQNVTSDRTIEKYAEELKNLISQKQLDAYQIANTLDSSFPKRLIECKNEIKEEEFNRRFAALNTKHQQLQQFGMTTGEQSVTAYDKSAAKVLSVYLDDSEQKLGVYDDLLNKIELFVNILNEKRFAFKSIVINNAHGFYFQSDNGERLNLTDLSSGEQHEVVLLYELLFKTNPNTLILIDEPEISLHVMWQKAFIQDLQRIAQIKQISFFVATHSPQIIHNSWSLTRDLYDLANANN